MSDRADQGAAPGATSGGDVSGGDASGGAAERGQWRARRQADAARLLRGRFALPALVLLTVAALGAVAWASRPRTSAESQPPGQRAAVTSATRICPVPAASSNGTSIAMFSAPATGTPATQPGAQTRGAAQASGESKGSGQSPGSGQGTGEAQLAALGSSGPPLQQAAQPGRLSLYSPNGHDRPALRAPGAAQAPVEVRATGPMAGGIEAEETTQPQNGSGALTGIRCPEPGTDFWFAAPGQAAAGSIELYLINPDNQAASANVDIYTDSGPLQGSADTGLTVPPGGKVVQAVDKLAPGSQAVALHVRTTTGRVVAAVQAGGGSGSWLPVASQPATQQVIPGLPASGGGRRLYLADPGGSDADVSIQAVSPNGTYQPTGGGGIDVPSGTAASIDLSSMNGVAAALRVTSNVPVTAGLVAGGGYDAAAGPVAEQSVAAGNMSGHDYSTTLVLSAPAAAARVQVKSAGTSGGTPAGQLVTVPAGRSTAVRLPGPRGGSGGFAVVVTPLTGSGPVYAGRVLTGPGGAQTIMPMVNAPSWVPLPPLAGSLTAVMP